MAPHGREHLPPAAAEVERWCGRASEAEEESEEIVAGELSDDVAAFASAAIGDSDADAHALAFLALVTELWGAPPPLPEPRAPRARTQRAVLTAALARAVHAHVTARELVCAAWTLALRSTSDGERVGVSLRAIVQLHLAASAQQPRQFWLVHYPALVRPLRSLAESGCEGAHVRKHVVAAASLLLAQLAHAWHAPLSAPRLQPLIDVARLLATRDCSGVVRLQALGVLLELEAAAGSAEPPLGLLRSRALDKSPAVSALALCALCDALHPARASASDLALIIHAGLFGAETPAKCKRVCRAFVQRALTDEQRAEPPAELLARAGMARALMNFKGQGGGFTGCALFEELFDEQLAGAVFDAMNLVPAAPSMRDALEFEFAPRADGDPRRAEQPGRASPMDSRSSGSSSL